MRRPFLTSAVVIASLTTAATAQQPSTGVKLSDLAGVWHAKTMVGPKDSVVATPALNATATDQGWTMRFPGRDPVAVRVVSVGGDSVITEAGPYPSYLRPGQTVTVLRIVGHYKGNQMWGTFEAHYAKGEKLAGKVSATRMK